MSGLNSQTGLKSFIFRLMYVMSITTFLLLNSCTDTVRMNPLDEKSENYNPEVAATIIAANKANDSLVVPELSSGEFNDAVSSVGTGLSVELVSSSADAPLFSSTQDISSAIEPGVNTAPVIDQGPTIFVEMSEDGLPTPFALDVSATDDPANILTWELFIEPTHGTVTVDGLGARPTVQYVPPKDFNGSVTFALTVSDQVLKDTVVVSVSVKPVNDFPTLTTPASLSGVDSVGSVLLMSGACSDISDTTELPQRSFSWYANVDTANASTQVLLGSELSHKLTYAEMGKYIYGVMTCSDYSGEVISDTTEYSNKIGVRRAPVAAKVIALDGADDYVALPPLTLNLTKGLTVELLVYWENGSGMNGDVLLDIGDLESQENIIMGRYQNSDRLYFEMINGGVSTTLLSTEGFIQYDHWTHISVTLSTEGVVTLYKNSLVDTTASMQFPKSSITRLSNFIGKSNRSATHHKGKIENVRIWSDVRNQGEVFSYMFAPLVGTEEDLTAAWEMNSAHGFVVFDEQADLHALITNMDTISSWVSGPNTRQVSVNQVVNGTVARAGNNTVYETQQFAIEATPDSAYAFDSWTTTGDAVVADATAAHTTVSLNTMNAQVTPSYVLYPINALEFDGNDDWVDMGDFDNVFLGGFTFEAWVYWESIHSWARIFELTSDFGSSPGSVYIASEGASGNLYFDVISYEPVSYNMKIEGYIETGKWIHVAATVAPSGEAIIYKNGELAARNTNLILPSPSYRALCMLGRSNSDQDGYFHGKMDEIRIWKDVRTPAEIKNNMVRTLKGNEDNLLLSYNANSTSGAVLNDITGNYNGTLNSFEDHNPWVPSFSSKPTE